MTEFIRIFDQDQLSTESSMVTIQILDPTEPKRYQQPKRVYQIADAEIRTFDKTHNVEAAQIELVSEECEDDEGDNAYIARFSFTMFNFISYLSDCAEFEGLLTKARYTTTGEPEEDSNDCYKYLPDNADDFEMKYAVIKVYGSKSKFFNMDEYIKDVTLSI